ncbi:glycine radical enzyme activase [Enterovibrio norvegicus]|uniref:YjjW family glycine radical enzyme activase n=1 Tax=Enterovibrio norvegicus TaxID=188144 RepID=A0ABV4KYX6_9GAMM|nr:YjjW family glycine radical enzyme activase [Enterovibrio norvegicus]OEF55015.1 glycine radical enzyme activase [Enterovibrio norvegicus]OEF65096.1 glycine radical enzyme activase [Enterovibrio norvegicus]TKF14764.1 YjjW family glycine radical enzyme activase [Enterovibrio norvegicus]TKF31963.1 YjjW family glycine radical enzyme activase [Enterovibrio norvegicus]
MSVKPTQNEALVSRILTFSCVDGPGNRLVVFLQGCNFDCITCHNPHTINHCTHCGDCVKSCPSDALSIASQQNGPQQRVIWHADKCTHCDLCIDVCPDKSNPKIVSYSVDDMLALIRQHHFFLNGITISGGEATLQLPFIIALFKAVKSDPDLAHLTCYIDSNGSLSRTGWERVSPYLDGAMIDLKAWQSDTHLWLVGRDKHRVIDTIDFLATQNKLHEVRLLHIPGKSDLDTEVDAVGDYLNTLPKEVKIRLNAFQHHGVIGEALTWEKCSETEMNRFHDLLFSKINRPIQLPTIYT